MKRKKVTRYVIIGNSAAAVGCVEGIRSADSKGSITLIASEPHHTYSRPLISYLLYGKTDEQRMKYRPDDFYMKNGVTALLGKTAVGIDPKSKKVLLDDGQTVEYDKLLVATGSSPFVPSIEGLDQVEQKTSFMTLDDARWLEHMVDADTRVLILGAGLSILVLVVLDGAPLRPENIQWIDTGLFVAALVILRKAKWDPILTMCLCGGVGLVLHLVLPAL